LGQAGVSGHIQNAEATLNLVRRRADVSVEVWMQDASAVSRAVGQAADAVQRAEEAVEDEAGKKDRKKKVRDKMKVHSVRPLVRACPCDLFVFLLRKPLPRAPPCILLRGSCTPTPSFLLPVAFSHLSMSVFFCWRFIVC
jgi:hypothetical protein